MSSLPVELRPVAALMDAYGWFRLIEGEESPRVGEIIEQLLSPELRPALHQWYRQLPSSLNPIATEFHHRLSILTGESL